MSTHKTENSLSKDKEKTESQEKSTSIEEWAQRSFTRTWTLAEDTEVRSVEFEDGFLTVVLGRIVPELITSVKIGSKYN